MAFLRAAVGGRVLCAAARVAASAVGVSSRPRSVGCASALARSVGCAARSAARPAWLFAGRASSFAELRASARRSFFFAQKKSRADARPLSKFLIDENLVATFGKIAEALKAIFCVVAFFLLDTDSDSTATKFSERRREIS